MKVHPKVPSKRFNKWVHDRRNRWMVRIATAFFIGFLVLTAGVIGAFAWFSKDLPSPYKLTSRQVEQSTQIFDRNGVLLYDVYGDKNRTLVQLKDIPQYLKDATIATEDKNFYSHPGFDPAGIARSVLDGVTGKGLVSGGSTLTQQLVKNALLSNERTFTRKIKELILSVQIEKRYSKDEILQIYFNEIPYGGTAWGAEAGARQYFGKDVKDLNLLESAILAGLPQEPSYYSPFGAHPDSYKDRTKEVLQRMEGDGYITKDQENQALTELKDYKVPGAPSGLLKAPHFVLYVKDLLERKYGEQTVLQGGLKVYTTLDSKLQDAAQQVVANQVASEGSVYHYSNGAAMVMNPKDGEVLAMIGSKNYFVSDYDGQFNVATAGRQPGSSIKPINYVTGLKKGYTASTLFIDQQTSFPCSTCTGGKYTPQNYDGRFGHGHGGLILMRDALAGSYNIPAVKMLALNGVSSMLDTAHDMGITTLNDSSSYGLSLTLGGGEVKMVDMMAAYSAFANGGMRVDPVTILKVTDSGGKVLEQANLSPTRRVLDSGLSFIMSDMLADYNAKLPAFGQAAASNFAFPGHQVAVKTGTTDQIRDNWTFGYTPSYVVGTWVGNNDNTPINGRFASGVTGGAPMWHKIFVKLFDMYHVPQEQFQPPDDVVKTTIDAIYGTKPIQGDPVKNEYFLKSTVPSVSSAFQVLRLCTDEKKLATPADEAAGMAYDQTFVRTGDPFSPGGWSPFDPPTDHCSTPRGQNGSSIVVNVTAPAAGSNVGASITATATVAGSNPIQQVQIFFDGSLACTATSGPSFSCGFTVPSTTQSGSHTISARAFDNQGLTGDSGGVSVNFVKNGGGPNVLGDWATRCAKDPRKCSVPIGF
jgi:1A family penicillin-binding protein